jgi:NAD(P)H-hydrate epimerase
MYHSTAKEMEKLDILAVKNGLEIRQMMELAGFHMVEVFRQLKIKKSKKITIVCGTGNKGGDGLSAARHLHNYGYKKISVILVSSRIKDEPKHHLNLLKKIKIPIHIYTRKADELIKNSDILIDALIGYHLDGPPRGKFSELIEVMNKSKKRIISYDLPSGASAAGKCLNPCIKAHATLTLALPKKIFRTKKGMKMSGKVFLADIGIPAFLYDKIKENSRPAFDGTNQFS